MNKDIYNSMPDDLKAVVDMHSGMDWAQKQALVFDDLDTLGREEAVKAGHSIITLDGGVNNPA